MEDKEALPEITSIIHGGDGPPPEGLGRKYPRAGKRPVQVDISTWVGIVGHASHYMVVLKEEDNPLICNCNGKWHEHVFSRWEGEREHRGETRTLVRVTNPKIAWNAIRRLHRLYKKSETHTLVPKYTFDTWTVRDILRPSRYRSGD